MVSVKKLSSEVAGTTYVLDDVTVITDEEEGPAIEEIELHADQTYASEGGQRFHLRLRRWQGPAHRQCVQGDGAR